MTDTPRPRGSFRDTADRVWTLSIDVGTIKRVRSLTGAEIKTWANDKFQSFAAVLGDVERLCDVLFAFVRPEADRLGVTDEAFASALGGDALEAGRDALYDAFMDFSPSQARPMLLALKTKGRTYVEMLVKEGVGKIQGLDLEAMVERTLSGSAGNSPGSAESIPTA